MSLHQAHVPEKLTFGCQILDFKLGGGIPCKSITEIVGESGVGKTQICLQLSLNIQFPRPLDGLSFSTLYIQTGLPFPIRRLLQLRDSFVQKHSNHIQHEMIDNVYVERIDSIYQFMEQIPRINSLITASSIAPMPIKLIVVDDVTSLFRTYFDYNPRDMRNRADLMYQFSSKMREWATTFNLAVVVTNQVIDFIPLLRTLQVGRWEGLQTFGRKVCAALGDTWTTCVASRLFMSKDYETKRYLGTNFGWHFNEGKYEYVIVRDGVFGIPS